MAAKVLLAEREGISSSGDEHPPATVGRQVAQHYNAVPEKGLKERTNSRIFYVRNFNNWIKSVLIGEFLGKIRSEKQAAGQNSNRIVVLDLCCGKGGDLLKWKKGDIDHLICSDIADVSLQQCRSRYDEMVERTKQERRPSKMFSAQFILADGAAEELGSQFEFASTADDEGRTQRLDMCSAQFSLHYSFETESRCRQMLRNACHSLRPGGYFIGTIPDANHIVERVRLGNGKFENEICSVAFEDEEMALQPPLFGAKYHFNLVEVVDCPEYLVHFPLLKRMLEEEFDMELRFEMGFAEVLAEFGSRRVGQGRQLLGRMQALEPYPPDEDVELVGSCLEEQYAAASAFLNSSQSAGQSRTSEGRRKMGTLSKAEWEVATMYLAFAFQKK